MTRWLTFRGCGQLKGLVGHKANKLSCIHTMRWGQAGPPLCNIHLCVSHARVWALDHCWVGGKWANIVLPPTPRVTLVHPPPFLVWGQGVEIRDRKPVPWVPPTHTSVTMWVVTPQPSAWPKWWGVWHAPSWVWGQPPIAPHTSPHLMGLGGELGEDVSHPGARACGLL